MRKLMVSGGALLTALALATTLLGAKGEGVATNAQGQKGEFRFEATKLLTDPARVNGKGRFATRTMVDNAPANVVIEMGMAKTFVKDGHSAVFEGPGVMSVKRNDHTTTFHGGVRIAVTDRRRPGDPNTAPLDVYRIDFKAQNSDLTYHFDGLVTRGDLVVFEHNVN